MNARKSLLFVLPLIALVLMSCGMSVNLGGERVNGSGNIVTEERDVSNIERVSLRGMGNLTIIQGDEEGLTVKADDNLMQYIETRMEGRELVLEIERGINIDTDNEIEYTLQVNDLNRVQITGSGNVDVEGFATGDLSLEISGSGNINISDLKADELRARISGSGNLNLSGEVTTQDVTISGSGNYLTEDLSSESTELTITGAGAVTVWTEKSLDVRITGAGDVSYYGSPDVKQSITGGGSIKGLGEHN